MEKSRGSDCERQYFGPACIFALYREASRVSLSLKIDWYMTKSEPVYLLCSKADTDGAEIQPINPKKRTAQVCSGCWLLPL